MRKSVAQEKPARRSRPARIAFIVGMVFALVAGLSLVWSFSLLRASLPRLEGEQKLDGLTAPVRVERDAQGIPVVRGSNRLDVARVTGFVHAQERFFQMDLLRRRAAGELAELFGEAALRADREVRVFRFRAVAGRVLEAANAEERALLQAYSEGVNSGLEALGAVPFEYLVLRAHPKAWWPEDSALCVLAMFLRLQAGQRRRESALGVMHDVLPADLFEFLSPLGTHWDTPVEGGPFAVAPVPGPDILDLQSAPPRVVAREQGVPTRRSFDLFGPSDPGEGVVYGSNNWAVAGAHTVDGGALLANDMHLGLSVPNTWYRAALVFPGVDGERRVSGVMLPGFPFVAVGSNGQVAWGFTNSEGDWSDLVVLELDPNDPEAYLTPDGRRRFERVTETIRVKGSSDDILEVFSTVWGPVVDKDHQGRRRALRWVPLLDGGFTIGLSNLESARDVGEAIAIAAGVGIPHQNFVCADSTGRIGWTIMGRIPRRVGFDGRIPGTWTDGTRRWDGWLQPDEYPRIVDPPGGRIWTANARVVGGEKLRAVGVGAYALGARARQIHDDLMKLERADTADMLRIQLDDRAVFLERWRSLLLQILTAGTVSGDPRRTRARQYIEAWGSRASVDSVGYRIVRGFRQRVAGAVLGPLLAPCRKADRRLDDVGLPAHQQWEGPLWALLTQRPAHLLDPRFEDWEALLLGSLDRVLNELIGNGRDLAERTWGERNTVMIRHPLSRALPVLAHWLDMPHQALSGDTFMPRVQGPTTGASQRLAVSPGKEENGYMHMPGGQSGHPLSPHFADGHDAWVRGEPTPFLPGPAQHVLTLSPDG